MAGTMQPLFSQPAKSPPFLRLPVEIRRQIYHYVLPYTSNFDVRLQRGTGEPKKSEFNLTLVRQASGNDVWRLQKTWPRTEHDTGNDIVWRRGCIKLLGVNRQVHEECVDIIYGENTFVVDITFNSIKFQYRWRTANNLTPNRQYDFLDHFSMRNLMRIKNYIINVEHVDDYTGMIKYNCQGHGLDAGVRAKVQELVDLLKDIPQLHRLHIHLVDGAISRVRFPSGRVHRVQDAANYSQSQLVLHPFETLEGVRRAIVTGSSCEYAKALEERMSSSKDVL